MLMRLYTLLYDLYSNIKGTSRLEYFRNIMHEHNHKFNTLRVLCMYVQ